MAVQGDMSCIPEIIMQKSEIISLGNCLLNMSNNKATVADAARNSSFACEP